MREITKPDCQHWIGTESRYCREADGVRPYLPGLRCPAHTPAALKGKPEPQPGPGWPSRQQVAAESDLVATEIVWETL